MGSDAPKPPIHDLHLLAEECDLMVDLGKFGLQAGDVAFRLEARAQVLLKVAEASEMVWMKADLICLAHCRGTGRVKLGILKTPRDEC